MSADTKNEKQAVVKQANILIAGVGGQGSVLIGNLLGDAAIRQGLDVWVGETFGMSQRGGAVVSHVRMGEGELSPTTPQRSGDLVLGLEPMETLRVATTYLKEGGMVIVNPRPMLPSDVVAGLASYPPVEEILSALEEMAGRVAQVEAAKLAKQAGNTMTLNTVMLGALAGSGVFPIEIEKYRDAVSNGVPPKTVDVNLKAFELGLAVTAGK